MSTVMPPGSADEALEMLTAAMGCLAAADATAMTAEEQARCLRVPERATYLERTPSGRLRHPVWRGLRPG